MAKRILGLASDARFAGRTVDRVPVSAAEAPRRRLRRLSELGADVAIDLPRGSYLSDDAVLFDDGETILVVTRTPQKTLIVRFDDHLAPAVLVAHAARLGHAFGNQHVPLETNGLELRIPVTTSLKIACDTVRNLHLSGVETAVRDLPLGRHRPLPVGHAHGQKSTG